MYLWFGVKGFVYFIITFFFFLGGGCLGFEVVFRVYIYIYI